MQRWIGFKLGMLMPYNVENLMHMGLLGSKVIMRVLLDESFKHTYQLFSFWRDCVFFEVSDSQNLGCSVFGSFSELKFNYKNN